MTQRVLSQVKVAEMGTLGKSSGSDTSLQNRQLWNSYSLFRVISPNREISATMVRPVDQNVSGKIAEVSPAGCTCREATQRSTKDQVVWLDLWLGLVPFWCGKGEIYCFQQTAELCEIAESCEIFRVLRRAADSAILPRGKTGTNMNEKRKKRTTTKQPKSDNGQQVARLAVLRPNFVNLAVFQVSRPYEF